MNATHTNFMQEVTQNTWLGKNHAVRYALLAITGSLLLWASAKTQVPLWYIPMTMQPFAVLAIGMLYGSRLAFVTVGLYLLEGAVGLPVFAYGGGIGYFAGLSGGFLFGFLASATFCGFMAEKGWDKNIFLSIIVGVAGIAIIYAFGLAWMAWFSSKSIGLEQALLKGFYPFILGDAIKILLVAFMLPTAWKIIKK